MPEILQTPTDIATRGRSLAAIVAMTTYCDLGGAVRFSQGYLRRDWLMFAAINIGGGVPCEADALSHELDCDLIVAEVSGAAAVPVVRAGTRLWGRLVWRGSFNLWRDDMRGHCCLVLDAESDLHLWLASGRIVAVQGLPWRDAADRDLGYARAGAAYRRLMREG